MARFGIVAALAAAWLATSVAAEASGRRGESVCEAIPQADRIEAVDERGEMRLESGRRAKLAGIRLPDQAEDRGRAIEWLRESSGRTLQTAVLGSADRWGRSAVIGVLDRDAGPIDLARHLVATGLALVDPGEADTLCRTDLLAWERQARDARLGLWQGGRYGPVPVDDLERLKELVGRFALVEGRVRSVGERQRRTYLNFGRDWASDFTLTIPQRTWDTMRYRGITAVQLRGRRVRVRGLLEEWQGPAMTLVTADLLEFVDSVPPPTR